MRKMLLILVMLLALVMSGHTQDKLKIGELNKGKLVMTNLEALKAYFLNSLDDSGVLGNEYQVSTSPEGDRCMVFYQVTGNRLNVSSIGVMLVKIKNDFYIVENPPETETIDPGGSGSLEIQCSSSNCNSCLPEFKWISGTWLPIVQCKCFQTGGSTCNMTSKVIIKVEL